MLSKKDQQHFLFISAMFFAVVVGFPGCASSGKAHQALAVNGGNLLNTHESESVHDAVSALKAVTGSMSDKEMTDEELYQAARRMQEDPEAKTAVEAISSSFHQRNVSMKYSPVTGKRYSADMEFEPGTGVRLLPLE